MGSSYKGVSAGFHMGLEKIIDFLNSEKFSESTSVGQLAYAKKYPAGLQVQVRLAGSEWAIMPVIDVRELPPPEAMPIPSLLKWEIYWPENSFEPLKHTWNGNANDLKKLRETYINILELFRKISVFYGLAKR